MVVSNTVTAGMTATAQQYNDLREDAISKVRENQIPLLVHGTAQPAMALDAANSIHSVNDILYFADPSLLAGGTLSVYGSAAWDYALGTVTIGVAGTLYLYDETGGTPFTDQYFEFYDSGAAGASPGGAQLFNAFTVTAFPGSAFRLGVRGRRTAGGGSYIQVKALSVVIRN